MHLAYRSEIDGLRAVAVVSVILFHADETLLSGGFVGVDIFFVISGFLITSIILREIHNRTFSMLNFYERRARRILPALFVVSFACIPFAWSLMRPDQLDDFAKSLGAVALFSSNFLFWYQTDYFAAAAELKPLLHTWTLAVEEQYYIVFPILLICISKLSNQKKLYVFLAIAFVSLAYTQFALKNFPIANFYLFPSRAWELLIGSITSLAFIKRRLLNT